MTSAGRFNSNFLDSNCRTEYHADQKYIQEVAAEPVTRSSTSLTTIPAISPIAIPYVEGYTAADFYVALMMIDQNC